MNSPLAQHRARHIIIIWKEDARLALGEDWIFEPGGLGVFDSGINALSILPEPILVVGAQLDFPANREAPIAAELELATAQVCRSIVDDLAW